MTYLPLRSTIPQLAACMKLRTNFPNVSLIPCSSLAAWMKLEAFYWDSHDRETRVSRLPKKSVFRNYNNINNDNNNTNNTSAVAGGAIDGAGAAAG